MEETTRKTRKILKTFFNYNGKKVDDFISFSKLSRTDRKISIQLTLGYSETNNAIKSNAVLFDKDEREDVAIIEKIFDDYLDMKQKGRSKKSIKQILNEQDTSPSGSIFSNKENKEKVGW